jgi:dUTP pyrophosphatase
MTTEQNILQVKVYNDLYITKKDNYDLDAGFDIFTPENHTVPANTISYKISLGISVHLIESGCYLYARSSTGSKTPLRLANSVGIIDEGYTGEVIAVVDNISNNDYNINKGDRLFQICAPNLKPLKIVFVEELSTISNRGAKGFGSSG